MDGWVGICYYYYDGCMYCFSLFFYFIFFSAVKEKKRKEENYCSRPPQVTSFQFPQSAGFLRRRR